MLRDNAVVFLSELRKKVEAGLVSKKDAERLAVLALEEVQEAEVEQAPTPPPKEDVVVEAPAAEPEEAPVEHDVVDPKSRILAALTKLEQALAPVFKDFQNEVNSLLKETKDAAIPLGEFTIGAEELNAKVAIAQKDKQSVICTYTFKQDWAVDGLDLPDVVTASAGLEDACHLGLRRDVLALADEVLENAASSSTWDRYQVPHAKITSLHTAAKDVRDLRVLEVTSNVLPTKNHKAWEAWAISALTQLLGSDYVKAQRLSITPP